jgi:hypothetical protein
MRARLRQVVEQVEDFVGVALVATDQRDRWQVTEQEFVTLASEAEELGLHALDYFQGRPQEMAHERRKRIAQKSRVALKFDPLAAAEAQLLADFAFAKGVPIPTARDPQVQDVIRRGVDGREQRGEADGLLGAAQALERAADGGRAVRDALHRGGPGACGPAGRRHGGGGRAGSRGPAAAAVVHGACPEVRVGLRERPGEARADVLRRREAEGSLLEALAQLRRRGGRAREGARGRRRNAAETPPAAKMAKGVVYHVAINQTGEELRGNPPWARSLRFFSAMNVLTRRTSRMAQARARSWRSA